MIHGNDGEGGLYIKKTEKWWLYQLASQYCSYYNVKIIKLHGVWYELTPLKPEEIPIADNLLKDFHNDKHKNL